MTQRSPRRGKPGLIVLLIGLALMIAGVDQITKYLAEDRLTPGVVVPLIGDYLGLQLIYNPGAAFSLATGMTWVLTVIMVVVILVVLRVSRRLRSTAWAVALGMLLGGALGNLYDRLLRDPGFGRGHVVDFINYNGWFVGNVADIAIVAAAGLIAILALRGVEIDGTRATTDDDEPQDVASSPEEDLSEEPLVDDGFSAEVPRVADGEVDVASWAAAAPSASTSGQDPVPAPDLGEPAPARGPTPAGTAPGAPAAAPAPRTEDATRTGQSTGTGRPAAPTEPAVPPRDLTATPPAPATPQSTTDARDAAASGPDRPREAPRRRPSRRGSRLAQQDDDG